MSVANIRRALRAQASPERAAGNQRFFKTGPGEYSEGDIFIGVTVPAARRIAREFRDAAHTDILVLLKSEIHEERLLALLILTMQYTKGADDEREKIYRLYLRHLKFVNNWDLVDGSAAAIVGAHLIDGDRSVLRRLARSKVLWERRVAIIATFHFIRAGDLDETFRLAADLLEDPEDLMHKAVGWMLREAGKRNVRELETFLRKHHAKMPRTMLRYAIERFPEKKRQAFLRGKARPRARTTARR